MKQNLIPAWCIFHKKTQFCPSSSGRETHLVPSPSHFNQAKVYYVCMHARVYTLAINIGDRNYLLYNFLATGIIFFFFLTIIAVWKIVWQPYRGNIQCLSSNLIFIRLKTVFKQLTLFLFCKSLETNWSMNSASGNKRDIWFAQTSFFS